MAGPMFLHPHMGAENALREFRRALSNELGRDFDVSANEGGMHGCDIGSNDRADIYVYAGLSDDNILCVQRMRDVHGECCFGLDCQINIVQCPDGFPPNALPVGSATMTFEIVANIVRGLFWDGLPPRARGIVLRAD